MQNCRAAAEVYQRNDLHGSLSHARFYVITSASFESCYEQCFEAASSLQTLMASLCSTLQVACVVRAFQHLHQRHIIYRDMQLGSLQGDSFGKQSTRLFWTSVNQPFPQEARESSTGLKGILQGTATSVRQEVEEGSLWITTWKIGISGDSVSFYGNWDDSARWQISV